MPSFFWQIVCTRDTLSNTHLVGRRHSQGKRFHFHVGFRPTDIRQKTKVTSCKAARKNLLHSQSLWEPDGNQKPCMMQARGGGTPGSSWWGCAAWFSKSWAYFRPKNVISQTCFQPRPLKSMVYDICRLQTADCRPQIADCKLKDTKNLPNKGDTIKNITSCESEKVAWEQGWCFCAKLHWPHFQDAVGYSSPTRLFIVGFHMTSLTFKLKNYRSYWDFTFTMHKAAEN